MFCPNCGQELSDSAKFCKYCGVQIKNNNSDKFTSNAYSNNQNNIIIALIIIALIILVAIAYFAFSNNVFEKSSELSSVASDDDQQVSLESFPISQAPSLANTISNSGYNFPVQFKSLTLTKSQCLYILTKSISQIAAGNDKGTISVSSPYYASNPSGYDFSQTITDIQYIDMSNRFSSWIERNGVVPNYVGINTGGVPDISPNKMLEIATNVLIQYGNTGSLPITVNI